MSDPLGLSIGTTNMVATSVGGQSVTRRAVLTLPTHGTPVIGVPAVDGLVLSGFVERVGDPVPLVASDGSSYAADDLLVEALEVMAGAQPAPQTAIAYPAHWTAATVRTLRAVLRTNPVLAPNGTPPRLVSDAVATLTSLRTNPGLSGGGPVALLDFGGGGTSITLADAGAAFEPLDETLRVTEFSGDLIDQAVLTKVLGGVTDADPAATAAVGLLGQLREECRQAKERLSSLTATEVPVALPGHQSVVRVTRAELEELLADPFGEVLSALDDLLQRNRIAFADLSAVATVGGGASIPLITQRLSEHTRIPVVTTAQPALDAAIGAALFAAYGAESDLRTGLAPIAPDAPTGLAPTASDAPTGLAPAGTDIPTQLGSTAQGAVGALAWSQDDAATGDPVPYTGGEIPFAPYAPGNPYAMDAPTRAVAHHVPGSYDEPPRTWQRLPILVFAAAGVLTLVALGGVAVALTGNSGSPSPSPT
ncbi:MAG: Hsp70 family protein, partial [Mycobacterium sp.]